MKMKKATGELVSVAEAARRLGISKESVYLAIREGRLPAVVVLEKVGVRTEDIASYQPRGYAGKPGRKVGGRPRKKEAGS